MPDLLQFWLLITVLTTTNWMRKHKKQKKQNNENENDTDQWIEVLSASCHSIDEIGLVRQPIVMTYIAILQRGAKRRTNEQHRIVFAVLQSHKLEFSNSVSFSHHRHYKIKFIFSNNQRRTWLPCNEMPAIASKWINWRGPHRMTSQNRRSQHLDNCAALPVLYLDNFKQQ